MIHHQPVLLAEILALAGEPMRVADATLGDGGHAAAFLDRGAAVLGVDRDPEAVARARARLEGKRLTVLTGPYDEPAIVAQVRGFEPDVALFDLGVSSRQLDDDALGFSFRLGAPLDMRMSRAGRSAAELLNGASETDLTRYFADWADERRARRLAGEIVRRRRRAPFATSDDLVNAIRAVLGPGSGPADFARIFQAVRIATNEELDRLARGLPAWREALVPGGLLLVISYHSGEDRLVKHAFHEWARSCVCPPEWPVCRCRGKPLGRLEPRRPVRAQEPEIAANPRARSAMLRGFRTAP
jgi:16S rRNA (cytosine1402-N4)-methyltransferase